MAYNPRNMPAEVEDQFAEWARAAIEPGTPITQHPSDELLAEHFLMRAVFDCMAQEAEKVKTGGNLQLGFWLGVADFVDNFVHMCHRAKEDMSLFPTLHIAGILKDEDSARLRKDHKEAVRLSLCLRDAANQGDNNGVAEVVSEFLQFMEEHLQQEENTLLKPAAKQLTSEHLDSLRKSFDQLESNLGDAGYRARYILLARRLCEAAGLEYPMISEWQGPA